MSTKLITLYGDEINDPYFTYHQSEAEYAAVHGDMPETFYARNTHARENPELLGFFIADIIKGVATVVTGGVSKIIDRARQRRIDRDTRKADEANRSQVAALTAQQNQTALQATQIQSSAGMKKIIIPVAIGVAGLVIVALVLKKRGR